MVGLLLVYASFKGIRVICFTFWRSPGDQRIEFEAGRSRVLFGQHQKWLAIDLAVVDEVESDLLDDKDEIRWSADPRYQVLGSFWESIGGIWGGRWKDPVDLYHFEVKEGLI